MDLEGSIPTFIHISNGRTHDVNVLDMIPIMAGSIYIMDRGYLDFQRLYDLHQSCGRFVIRSRKYLQFYLKSSTPVDRRQGLQCDQLIRLTGAKPKKKYPEQLCRIRLIDTENDQNIILLTNMKTCSAETICQYYKNRCRIPVKYAMVIYYFITSNQSESLILQM
jgi:hypothetical protein